MSDNKTKRGHPDRDLFNKNETYEVAYAVNELAKEYPRASKTVIKKALLDSAKVPNFHHNRKMILNSTRLKLDNK